MSIEDWENRVWTRVPWDRLTALGAVAIAWPMAAIAANDPRRPPMNRNEVALPIGDRQEEDP